MGLEGGWKAYVVVALLAFVALSTLEVFSIDKKYTKEVLACMFMAGLSTRIAIRIET